MPNRILREGILTSERIASLSWQAEVFYRRLMSVVDDYGRYFAKPMALRAACFPMQLDRVSDKDIEKWLTEGTANRLLRLYDVDNTTFLELLDFRQQVRAKKSKYPDPINGSDHHAIQTEKITRIVNPNKEAAKRLLTFLNEQAKKNFQPTDANLKMIEARLEEYDEERLRGVIIDRVDVWKADEKMEEYLRPATLFNKTKCAQYVGGLPQ
jgi:uncharacterized phage protein (TIGR02220 family)